MLDMDNKSAGKRRQIRQIIGRLGCKSRKVFHTFWNTVCACHRPEPATSKASPSTSHASTRVPTRVSSPYNGVPYHRVSALMDVDYFRGNVNADGISQNGRFEILKVVNPDLKIRSDSTFSRSSTVGRVTVRSHRTLRRTSTPRLPDLSFVASPEPSLYFDILTSILLEEGSHPPFERAASPLYSLPSFSISSLDESPIPSIARIVTWNTIPQELFFHPLGPNGPNGPNWTLPERRDYPSNFNVNRLACSTGTTLASDSPPNQWVSSIDSLVDLVDRFTRQWTRHARHQSDPTSRQSRFSHTSAASSARYGKSRQLSWSWGLFLSVESLPTLPIVLAAAKVAQRRRLRKHGQTD